MKKSKKLLSFMLAGAMLCSLAACGSNPDTTDTKNGDADNTAQAQDAGTDAKVYQIGIIQQMDHVALNGAKDGFIQALADNGYVDGENIKIDWKNGNGDTNNLTTIAEQFANDNKDLVLAIATSAAQAMASKTTTIPILATAVTDFEVAGLVESNDKPGGNVSGTSDMNPIAEQMDLLFQLCPDTKTVGFLYNSSEDNSRLQIDKAKEYLDAKSIAYVEKTVSSQNEVQQATQSIISECDAIYIPTDNVFASSMPMVKDVTLPAKIPVFCGEAGMVQTGGFATLGITYPGLGYQAGEMAVQILEGKANISEMPVVGSSEFEYCINKEVAQALGIEIPADLQQYMIEPEA